MQDMTDAMGAPQQYEGLEHRTYLGWWQEFVDMTRESRVQQRRDVEYYDGDVKGTGEGQWTTRELATLAERKQPPSVFNVIGKQIDATIGVEMRSRSEPRALPRTWKDQETAEIGTDLLRYWKERDRWNSKRGNVFGTFSKVGLAAVEIGGADGEAPLTPISWREFVYDPRSRLDDFSDARYLGVARWLDLDVAIAMYAGPEIPQPQLPPEPPPPDIGAQPDDYYEIDPETGMQIGQLWEQWRREQYAIHSAALDQHRQRVQQEIIAPYEAARAKRDKIVEALRAAVNDALPSSAASEDEGDLPREGFGDRARRRVFVVDLDHKDRNHGWARCVFTSTAKLYSEASPYRDDRGSPASRIVAHGLYLSAGLWRYGLVRNMRPVQDEVNKRRSVALRSMMEKGILLEQGSIEDIEEFRRELARTDAVLQIPQGASFPPQILRNGDMGAAQFQQYLDARQFLEAMGPNPQLRGERDGAGSGRAILALQQAGLGQLGPLYDAWANFELAVYRAVYARMRQFWTAPLVIRVTDDENSMRWAGVNGASAPNQDGVEQQGPMLADLDLDIILDRAPDAATLQQEQFTELAKLAPAYLQAGKPIPLEILIKASALPQKSELLEAMKAEGEQPNPQQQQQMQAMQMQMRQLEAKIAQMQAAAAKDMASAEQIRAETRAAAGPFSLGVPPQGAPAEPMLEPSALQGGLLGRQS